MFDPMLPNTPSATSLWQQFFTRYFALLRQLDAAKAGQPQHGEAAPPEHE